MKSLMDLQIPLFVSQLWVETIFNTILASTLKACSRLISAFASPSKFNIGSIAMQTLTQRMAALHLRHIDVMLNFDAATNADDKFEQSISTKG